MQHVAGGGIRHKLRLFCISLLSVYRFTSVSYNCVKNLAETNEVHRSHGGIFTVQAD